MENKINIAELLKACPQGMELDCTMYDNITLWGINERSTFPISIKRKDGIVYQLTKYGQPNNYEDSKCVIFPKGKTTWKGFHRPFKDGDVIYNKDINALAIFYKQTNASTISYCFLNVLGELRVHHYHSKDLSDWSFATEEEKEKLFKVIKDKGYHWNDETKTLEELPKFKIGNKIRLKKNHNYIYTITGIREKENKYECGVTFVLRVSEQDNWELVPDKFDVSKLKPFDKVLVRSDNRHRWSTQFFERLNNKLKDSFVCVGGCRYQQCIPYEGNEYLLDTANECNNFFKVWEES